MPHVLRTVWNRYRPGRRKPSLGGLDELGEYRALCRARLEHVVDVREPLVLISQAKRSGGTLLRQLFDGHPEFHAHGHELDIGLAGDLYERAAAVALRSA